MPAPFIIPFNNNPVSTSRGTTATYTVPTGKYARVTISVDFSFTLAYSAGSGGAASALGNSQTAYCANFDVWMRAGETLVLAAGNTTGSFSQVNNSGATQTQIFSINGIAGTTVTVSGVLWKTFQSRAYFSGTMSVQNLQTGSASVTPTANFGWYAQEYNVIS